MQGQGSIAGHAWLRMIATANEACTDIGDKKGAPAEAGALCALSGIPYGEDALRVPVTCPGRAGP